LEESVDAGTGKPRRGFRSGQIRGHTILERFVSQQVTDREAFEVFAHLAIVPNPFDSRHNHDRHFIIILNGVSGPATFALTHVLTGGVNEEFVSYPKDFNPEAASESILKEILKEIHSRDFNGLECIIKVIVGPSGEGNSEANGSLFDWRRILKWEVDQAALGRRLKPVQ
jgi:predicted flavoprotein YhiN